MKTRLERAAEAIALKEYGEGDSRAYDERSIALAAAGWKACRDALAGELKGDAIAFSSREAARGVVYAMHLAASFGDEEEQEIK